MTLAPADGRWAVYVHFPFCIHRCSYCDFATVAAATVPRERALAATLRELELRTGSLAPAPIASIFFGGGTPSLWGPGPVGDVLRWLDAWGGIAVDAEITLEANPGAAESGDLYDYAAVGINRISLGVQATEDDRLRALDRVHDAESALATARQLGEMVATGRLASASADLLFGAPGQDMAALERDLDALMACGLPHLSAYALTVEPETPLGRMVARGARSAPDDDLQAAMLEAIPGRLAPHGLERYEVSNFARPGHESRHNLAYWRGDHYLAVGVGAHGFLPASDGPGARYGNTRSIGRWFAAIDGGGLAEDLCEAIDPDAHLDELLLTGLRLREGVRLPRLAARVGTRAPERVRLALQRLMATPRGRLADGSPAFWLAADRVGVTPAAVAGLDGLILALVDEIAAV
ncbi:MAG: hypothetical protein RIT45_2592 [Pseudomonadota bacterium]|jgi:oxygen-independent coproporphyrinogen-3 oxidase